MAESWNGHVVTLVLPRGEGNGIEAKIECKEGDIDDSPCNPDFCAMKDVYDQVGWDVFKSAGEIDLVKLSARMDWSTPDEPWIEVEP